MNNQFRVVKIIDDTSLIINGGSDNNVEVGDLMEIHGKSETIFDPLTKEDLGKFDIVKDKLTVAKVYEKMCICETTYVSTYLPTLLSNSLFSTKQKKMNVEPTDISGTCDKTIRIGDEAILIKKLTNELTDGELTNDKLVEEISQNEQ